MKTLNNATIFYEHTRTCHPRFNHAPGQGPVLPAWPDFAVAIATINRPIATRFKGDFGFLAALCAGRGKHLALPPPVAAAPITLRLPCLAARGTALWLVDIAPGLEKLLLLSAEGEGSHTIGTLERLVLETHWMTSSL